MRETTVAVCDEMKPRMKFEPQHNGTPAMWMLSLIANVLPDNLPLSAPTIFVKRALWYNTSSVQFTVHRWHRFSSTFEPHHPIANLTFLWRHALGYKYLEQTGSLQKARDLWHNLWNLGIKQNGEIWGNSSCSLNICQFGEKLGYGN